MKRNKILLLIAFTGLFYFAGCKEKSKSDKKTTTEEPSSKNYTEIGSNYAKSTQKELGTNLMAAIQKEGTLGALEFCNVQAYPLTDSMAVVHHAKIKRVSDKPRNPFNQANDEELGYIEAFKNMIATGDTVEPIINDENGQMYFYSPITTNAMCLQCHGKPEEQIQPATMAKLQELYPADEAVGYTDNELRGIWAITFDKEQ